MTILQNGVKNKYSICIKIRMDANFGIHFFYQILKYLVELIIFDINFNTMNELATLLITDIKNAHRLESDLVEETDETMAAHFAEIENYLNGSDSGPTFSNHCGLESQFFPPADFFNEVELKIICEEFDKMMFTYNLTIDYPEKIPVSMMNKSIIETLDTQTSITNHGMLHFDYCSGYAPDCFWKEYCSCLEFWKETDDGLEIDEKEEGELPF